MRPKRIGINEGIRPALDLSRSSMGSPRSFGGFHPACDARWTASRSALPLARRLSTATYELVFSAALATRFFATVVIM
jgi:hypothetical protein